MACHRLHGLRAVNSLRFGSWAFAGRPRGGRAFGDAFARAAARTAIPNPATSRTQYPFSLRLFGCQALPSWLPSPDFSIGRSAPNSPLTLDGFRRYMSVSKNLRYKKNCLPHCNRRREQKGYGALIRHHMKSPNSVSNAIVTWSVDTSL